MVRAFPNVNIQGQYLLFLKYLLFKKYFCWKISWPEVYLKKAFSLYKIFLFLIVLGGGGGKVRHATQFFVKKYANTALIKMRQSSKWPNPIQLWSILPWYDWTSPENSPLSRCSLVEIYRNIPKKVEQIWVYKYIFAAASYCILSYI